MKKLSTLILIFGGAALAQPKEKTVGIEKVELSERANDTSSGRPNLQELEENSFVGEDNFIEDPFSLRDPFKPPQSAPSKRITEKRQKELDRKKGIFSNQEMPSIEDLNDLTIVGVMVGKKRRAVAKFGSQKETFILKEGMKVGNDQAELKAILPGGVVFVERITNIYGQVEYLETVLPITK